VAELVEAGVPEERAKATVAKMGAECMDLPGSYVVQLYGGGAVTVGELLSNPERYDGRPMADPIEGRDYGQQTAMFFANEGGKPVISSFAHGGQIYFLHHDLTTALEVIQAAPKEGAIDAAVAILTRDSRRAGYIEGLTTDQESM